MRGIHGASDGRRLCQSTSQPMHVLYTLHVVLSHTAAQQTAKYLRVAPAAIWILDYFLTFEHEVRLFSNINCWNIVIVMFILARYAPVIWVITEIYLTLSPHSAETCLTLYRTSGGGSRGRWFNVS
ncbi:hypothetical protein BDR06DRAFT_790457 [Suillus hirtellus]|nr:hypothetical protein BDR06DRAFT_790457 [Suillus hirtellus]